VALELFRSGHVRQLLVGIPQNLPRYQEKKAWAHRDAGFRSAHLSCSLEPAVPLELEMPDAGDMKDLENSKIVYQAFPQLTPLQARDPRLWTRLTHVECWPYMRKRWAVERHAENPARAMRYVQSHYFVPQAQSRALLRNGIARLWWYSHLTHNPRRTDPFELTGVLLSYLDIAQQLLERNMGRASTLRACFLDYIRVKGDKLGDTASKRRERIREMARILNLRGGVTLLDCLGTAEIVSILDEELQFHPQ
jgi:hypothetical protein